MRNKLLLTAFVSVIITGMPALAVDYIACREMLRTKNEFISISNQYEKTELGTKSIYNTKKDWDKCWFASFDKIKSEKELDEDLEKYSACMRNRDKEENRRRNQGETKRMGLHFITDEGHYYYKKALKVEVDMKRANCPY